jgi:hypothetical protein
MKLGKNTMSNIIPNLTDQEIQKIPSKAEQLVFKALQKQIPDDWLIIHSLEFVTFHPKYESHADREADFVVFAPEYGVLVVEVKGGGIGYDKEIDAWYSIDRNQNEHVIKNPLRQAKDAKYEIRRHLSYRLKGKNLLIAHAALFPDIDDAGPLNGHDSPIEILGTNKALENIHSWCVSIYNYWSGKEPKFDSLGALGINIVKDIYGKKVTIKSSLAVAIERESEIQIQLTNQQKNILRQLKRRKKAIIEGGAGTGKTVLALDHAQSLAEQGLKVLLLCYNKPLGNVLKKRCEGINNLHAMNFHELCYWRIEQVKKTFNRDLLAESRENYAGENEFDILYPDALINSYEIVPLEYDAIIVDEGQDFRDEYWLAIDMLFDSQNEDSRLYIFQDGNQAIYSSSSDLPINELPLYLSNNCRNTRPIHNAAYKYYEGEEIDAPEIEGEPIQFIIGDTLDKQASYIDKKISNLIIEEKVSPEDIVLIVSNDYNIAESLLKNTKNSKLWAFKDFEPKKHVLVETAKRFKGLESKIIFFWITDPYSIDEKLLYVSISRARLRLWIIGNEAIASKIGGNTL